ncbi:hypothetical protein PRUPE_5G018300 [Prunus persica]|uniref:Uncharacterized protein n=1 Tax=Prunus persica TaxID=3760 RepID=A0A251P220_PRUPE|nr:hypothetical protein PRUPE_5G018300 [Prunus persica]
MQNALVDLFTNLKGKYEKRRGGGGAVMLLPPPPSMEFSFRTYREREQLEFLRVYKVIQVCYFAHNEQVYIFDRKRKKKREQVYTVYLSSKHFYVVMCCKLEIQFFFT